MIKKKIWVLKKEDSLSNSSLSSLAKKLVVLHVFTVVTLFVSNQFLQLNRMMAEAWAKDDVWAY